VELPKAVKRLESALEKLAERADSDKEKLAQTRETFRRLADSFQNWRIEFKIFERPMRKAKYDFISVPRNAIENSSSKIGIIESKH